MIALPLFSQEISIEEVYPQLQKVTTQKIDFSGCVSGNCRSGEGTYMTIRTTGSGTTKKENYSYHNITVFVYRGVFYKNGLTLVGKEYGFNTHYRFKDANAKKMEPQFTASLDGSDPQLNKYLNYEGEFKFQEKTFVRQGEGKLHYATRNFDEVDQLMADFYNGYTMRQTINFSDKNNPKGFNSYEGWLQPSFAMTVGKLTFNNGDVYQGTFFNNEYEGLGRLTTATGVQEGYWEKGKLIKKVNITLSNEALEGITTTDQDLWIEQGFYEATMNGNHFGTRTDKSPEGQGLFFNNLGYTKVGNFSEGKLNGYGLRVTNKSLSDGKYPIVHEIGEFKDDELVLGTRTNYAITAKDYTSHTLSVISTKSITPSTAVTSQNVSPSEVVLASDNIDDQYNQAIDLFQKKEYSKAVYIFEKIIPQRGYMNQYATLASFCYLMLKDLTKAEKYAQQSLTVNQTDYNAYLVNMYVEIARNNMTKAKEICQEAFYFDINNQLNVYTDDLVTMSNAGINSVGCEEMIAYINSQYPSRNKTYKTIDELMGQGGTALNTNITQAKTYFDKGISACTNSPKPWLKAYAYYVAGASFYYAGQHSIGNDYLNQGYLESINHKNKLSPYPQLFIAVALAEFASNANDLSKVKGYLTNARPLINELGSYANDLKAKYHESWCRVYNKTNEYNALISEANKLHQLKNTGYDQYYATKALNYLGMGYGLSGTAEGRKTSRSYYEQALALAEKNGFVAIQQDIEANLPLAYWQAGDKTEAIELYENIIRKNTETKNFQGAENATNNLAYLLFLSKDYLKAVKYFRQSIDLTEKARLSFSGADRINYLQGKTSAYQGLIYCLAKLNRVDEVFEAQQKDRARVLLENLSQESKAKSVTLTAYQQSLAPDETAVFYSLFEAGSVIITTVSKQNASVRIVEQQKEFFELKGRYLDLMYKGKPGYSPINIAQAKHFANINDRIGTQFKMNDFNLLMELLRGVIDKSITAPTEAVRTNLIDDLMNRYYAFLIAPIEQQLTGKNKIILYPDGILNFLPFEAVRPTNGKYLVERFDVRYGRSADVSELLRNRVYTNNRKSFLAMGGALYGRMNEHNSVDKRNVNFTDLKIKAALNASEGKSQREIYASIFGEKMNYLEGTLTEVNNLSKIFAEPTVFTGNEMTENRIKQLAQTKELQNYKIIHLATHGFSIPEFPELSGIAMCIFPDAQNGEDGYLTAPEIAQLDMKADMVVLSACETALGKIYGGEGVAGLTQSILEGGANSAMVSLWPVNDAGTMYFMTGLYELTEKQGKNYNEAINLMKRKFISGEFGAFFQDPVIWAPFVHYSY